MSLTNLSQDHWLAPIAIIVLSLANEAAKLGFTKVTMIAVLSATVLFAAIQAAHDLGEKWIAAKYPAPSAPPKTS